MSWRPPSSTRTDSLFPSPTLFRSTLAPESRTVESPSTPGGTSTASPPALRLSAGRPMLGKVSQVALDAVRELLPVPVFRVSAVRSGSDPPNAVINAATMATTPTVTPRPISALRRPVPEAPPDGTTAAGGATGGGFGSSTEIGRAACRGSEGQYG